ncbi:MAG: DUF3945 domain-containing protein [Prevotellaceae bacterium]|jgi:hypothetical protein|nr:DUF3945 domain-containing protein [Prevotellaceae bacterium]
MEDFSMDEVPFDCLATLGMTKSMLLKLDNKNLTRLLTGQRTDILRFDFYHNGKRYLVDGKLLLQRKPDRSVSASIVPVRKSLQNDCNLTTDEQIKLYTGKLINKNIDGQRHILQLDRETNEVLRAKTSHIKLPFDIDVRDRERLLTGKSIKVQTETGPQSIRLDLLNDRKFSYEGEQQQVRYAGSFFVKTDLSPDYIKRYNLKEADIQRLLDGYKTDLIDLDSGVRGRLGLKRNEDKSASLEVYPVKNEINNDISLQPDQIEKLKRGELVSSETGGKIFLIQLDRETNDLVRAQKDNIVPDAIRGYELKEDDKQRLMNGRSIHFTDPRTGETISAKIDLNHVRGIALKDDTNKLRALYISGSKAEETLERQTSGKLERDKFLARNNLDLKDLSNSARAAFDERQKFYFDYHNPGVMSYIRTDRNAHEFMVFRQTQTQTLSLKL